MGITNRLEGFRLDLPDNRMWMNFYVHPNFDTPHMRITYQDPVWKTTEVLVNCEIQPEKIVEVLQKLIKEAGLPYEIIGI